MVFVELNISTKIIMKEHLQTINSKETEYIFMQHLAAFTEENGNKGNKLDPQDFSLAMEPLLKQYGQKGNLDLLEKLFIPTETNTKER